MAIDATVTRRTDGGWDFAWDVETPPYSVYLEGLLLATVAVEAYACVLPNHEDVPPDLEIRSAGDPSQGLVSPPYQTLQWRGVKASIGYVVEELVNAEWVEVVTVSETGRGYYAWRSAAKDDDALARYRVYAVDLQGNAGAILAFSIDVCCNPRHPAVALSVSSSGALVVAAA